MLDTQDSTPPERTYRNHLDIVAEHYRIERDEALVERDETRADRDAYRDLSKAAIEKIAEMTQENKRLRLRLRQVLDELHILRQSERRAA